MVYMLRNIYMQIFELSEAEVIHDVLDMATALKLAMAK